MRIDENIIQQARTADVLAFLEKYHGFTFAHRGGEYRCKQHPSLAVRADRLSWYWHSKGIGGYCVLDYLTKVENIPFRQAVEIVTGATPQLRVNLTRQEAEPPKTLKLPEAAGVPLKLYDYLCVKRGIDGEVVNTLLQKEMIYEDRRGNVVFVGMTNTASPVSLVCGERKQTFVAIVRGVISGTGLMPFSRLVTACMSLKALF